MKKSFLLPDIPEQDQAPLVKTLLGIIEEMATHIQYQIIIVVVNLKNIRQASGFSGGSAYWGVIQLKEKSS